MNHPIVERRPPFGFSNIRVASLALLLTLSGCSAYHLGTPANQPFTSIDVPPVQNEAFAPQAGPVLTSQIIREFERDGRVRPESSGSAEATLVVRLVDLQRETRVMREEDTGLARKVRLTLIAHCTLTSGDGATVYFANRPISAQTEVFLDDGQNPAESQAMPVLTRNLASAISRSVLDTW
ncbi:MAG: LPS assembly lipoprotein LptE [Opitutaceae bacterium]